MEKKLLDELLYFPSQTCSGQFLPTDLWVSQDWKDSWLSSMKGQYPRFNPSEASLGGLLFSEALLAINQSNSTNEYRLLTQTMHTGKVAVVSAHSGIHCPNMDEKWRYAVGSERYPLVEDLFREMDKMGFDLIYLAMCNRGRYRLTPKHTPVIQLMGSPADGPRDYILIKPVK